ncbi:hypothetical protein [Rhodococcus aerolatus]
MVGSAQPSGRTPRLTRSTDHPEDPMTHALAEEHARERVRTALADAAHQREVAAARRARAGRGRLRVSARARCRAVRQLG